MSSLKSQETLSPRREARERAMQTLFAFSMSGTDLDLLIREHLLPHFTNDEAGYEFSRMLVRTVASRQEECETLIREVATNWAYERIALVDRVLIALGIIEFRYCEDVPPNVTTNELIEIAKKYSTDESGAFVNGVLDALKKRFEKDGTLKKSGRGLISSSDIKIFDE